MTIKSRRAFGVTHALAAAFTFLVAVTALITPADARSGPWVTGDAIEARLVSAGDTIGGQQEVILGVEMKLKDGWKTYWRSPGDAGLPPAIDWAGSTNFSSATFSYPSPDRFQLFGLQTFGYSKHVVLPVRATVTDPSQPADLKARLDVLVCEKICVPYTLDLALTLAPGAPQPSPEAQLINRFQSAVPNASDASGLSVVSVKVIEGGDKQSLQTTIRSRDALNSPDVYAEIDPPVALHAPTVSLSSDGKQAILTQQLTQHLPSGATLAGRPVTLTVIDAGRSFETKTAILAGTTASFASELTALAAMLALAFLGGVILNLMPCVLPILSMKLISFVSHAESPPARIRLSFLATAAGIVFSMLMIAAGLVALKATGHAIGWGIQFQQPLFIVAMTVILMLFACSFWGLFDVALPSWATNALGQTGSETSLGGNFVIGAFATLLATPCSAPFVGTAVGFALAQGPAQIFAIFSALGLGLALPYLAVAAVPRLARALPKPGPWMMYLRAALGLALTATALWLLTVLDAQSGRSATLIIAILLATLVAALRVAKYRPARRTPAVAAAGVLIIATLLIPAFKPGGPDKSASSASSGPIGWVAFDASRIKGLVAQGKTVFVDVTADWCITCKANKAAVINRAPASDRLAKDVIAMRADWTSPNPAIGDFLASFGRYGIPLNVVFGPGRPAGILLPEILTAQSVMDALDQASGQSVRSDIDAR